VSAYLGPLKIEFLSHEGPPEPENRVFIPYNLKRRAAGGKHAVRSEPNDLVGASRSRENHGELRLPVTTALRE
jgi:hypothetical protein